MTDNIVTGGSGFIGKYLLAKLDKSGEETTAIPHYDIQDFKMREFHRFFFLSTYGNMSDQQDVKKILRANIMDVRYLLNSILELRFPPDLFVFVSSSSVNLQVQTAYSRTKKAAELIIQASGVPCCIVRPYSVTGVSEQPQHLIPTLIRSCFKGTKVALALRPTHDFVDVDDVANGLIALARNKAQGVFEFGSGIDTTNEEVMELVETATGRKANVRVVEENIRPYDNEKWVCEDFEAQKHGWYPKKSLSLSIHEMVEAYRA